MFVGGSRQRARCGGGRGHSEGVFGGLRRAGVEEVRHPDELSLSADLQGFDGQDGRRVRLRADWRAPDPVRRGLLPADSLRLERIGGQKESSEEQQQQQQQEQYYYTNTIVL